MKADKKIKGSKNIKGSASQYYVAAELSRRGFIAALTLGNCPTTDILCSTAKGTNFCHVQVKTFTKGNKKCAVGLKAETDYGEPFFWVLVGIPENKTEQPDYYVIPTSEMAKHVRASFKLWCEEKETHSKDNPFRGVQIPPYTSKDGWNIKEYLGRWDLIEDKLNER